LRERSTDVRGQAGRRIVKVDIWLRLVREAPISKDRQGEES
jgi:hypothetical protein